MPTLTGQAPDLLASRAGPLLRASLSRAIRNISTGGMDPVEVQTARARELEALGLPRIAGWVEGCGVDHPWCRQRLCPRCAERLARRRHRLAASRVRRMARPVFFTLGVAVAVGDPARLADGIKAFRRDISRIRRNACFRSVNRGEGGIELKLAGDSKRWLVHAHLALDVPRGWDWKAAARRWSELTSMIGRLPGRMLPHPRWPIIEAASVWPVARYFTKASGWCPSPGVLVPERLDEWRRAIRGVRLPISWGGRLSSL